MAIISEIDAKKEPIKSLSEFNIIIIIIKAHQYSVLNAILKIGG